MTGRPDDITPAERLTELAASAARSNTNEPETSLWSGGYSPRAMIGVWGTCSFLTIVGLISPPFLAGNLSISNKVAWSVALGFIAFIWFWAVCTYFYRRISVHYELTTQRLIHKHGILVRTSDRIELIDINDVAFTQGIFERMFKVGGIQISSNDRSHPELRLIGIENVSDVAGLIDDARRKERRKRALHMA